MSSNGRTPDSDSGYIGSNPVVSASRAYTYFFTNLQNCLLRVRPKIGVSSNGRTTVSKTVYVGSNPTAPANYREVRKWS